LSSTLHHVPGTPPLSVPSSRLYRWTITVIYEDNTQLFFSFYPPDLHSNVIRNALQQISSRMIANFLTFNFLRASAMLKHVIDIGWTSVRLSVTRWYCIKTAKYIVMLSPPHDRPFILVLRISRSSRNSNGVTRCGAAKQRWGVKISQFSTNNLLYLRNG